MDLGSVAGLVLGVGLLVSALLTQESAWAWGGIAGALVTLVSGAVARRIVWVTGSTNQTQIAQSRRVSHSPTTAR